MIPEEVLTGPRASFQYKTDPTGFVCPMKFTVDSVLYQVIFANRPVLIGVEVCKKIKTVQEDVIMCQKQVGEAEKI